MNILKKPLGFSEHVLCGLCVLAFVVMVALAAATVFFRFVVNSSLAFTEEVVLYAFVWATFLGTAVGFRRNMHAAVEMFVDMAPSRVRRYVLALANFLCIAFFIILVVYGVRITALVHPQLSPALEIPMSYVYAAVPVGALFMLLYSLEALFAELPWHAPPTDAAATGAADD